MNMKQLRYVLALAVNGSFGKAADILGITQPSLSQYIKKIETQTGVELFDRSGGDVRLTDAGRVYVNIGKQILDQEHQMQDQFSDIAENKAGSVIVGTSPYRSAGMMPTVVKEFRNIYPGMQVVVEEITTSELLDATEHGQFDFCLSLFPVDKRLLAYEKVMEEERILGLPSFYDSIPAKKVTGKKYPAIDAAEINGQSFVTITESQLMQKTLENFCIDYNIELKSVGVVKSLNALIAMVRAGVGMALVSSSIEKLCSGEEVSFYSFKQDLPKREVAAIWRKDRKLSQVAKEMIEIMKKTEW